MKTVKAIIKSRMKELGMKPYDLSKAIGKKASPQTIYNFILRDAEMNTKTLGYVLKALDLEITVKK